MKLNTSANTNAHNRCPPRTVSQPTNIFPGKKALGGFEPTAVPGQEISEPEANGADPMVEWFLLFSTVAGSEDPIFSCLDKVSSKSLAAGGFFKYETNNSKSNFEEFPNVVNRQSQCLISHMIRPSASVSSP